MVRLAVIAVLMFMGACGGRLPISESSGHLEPCPCLPAGAREAGDDHLCWVCMPDSGAPDAGHQPGT